MRVAAIVVFTACAAVAQTGDWAATIAFAPGMTLRLALHLRQPPTLDSIDQDAFDLPLTNVRRTGARLSFDAPKPGGHFAGNFAADGRSLAGVWRQRGGSLQVRFVPGRVRPQEPQAPMPYRSEPVVLRNGRIRLAGTLTLPVGPGPHPAVVLLPGTRSMDRNETVSGHRPFLVWSDFLTRRGFAVLRTDDRGVGGSTGRKLDATDEELASDARAEVGWLKERRDIDAARIGLVGHSEGALIAPLAAGTDVAFLVLLAGPAERGDEILLSQSERVARSLGIPDNVAESQRVVERAVMQMARSGATAPAMRKQVEEATKELPPETAAALRTQLARQLDVAASRWFRFLLDYDPRPTLARLRCPVLALYGDLDVQVAAESNAPVMRSVLPHARVAVLPGINHMFQHAATGSPLEYTKIEETVAADVLRIVGEWLAGAAAYTPQQ